MSRWDDLVLWKYLQQRNERQATASKTAAGKKAKPRQLKSQASQLLCRWGHFRTATPAYSDVSFDNSTASTWTLATPRTTWESKGIRTVWFGHTQWKLLRLGSSPVNPSIFQALYVTVVVICWYCTFWRMSLWKWGISSFNHTISSYFALMCTHSTNFACNAYKTYSHVFFPVSQYSQCLCWLLLCSLHAFSDCYGEHVTSLRARSKGNYRYITTCSLWFFFPMYWCLAHIVCCGWTWPEFLVSEQKQLLLKNVACSLQVAGPHYLKWWWKPWIYIEVAWTANIQCLQLWFLATGQG